MTYLLSSTNVISKSEFDVIKNDTKLITKFLQKKLVFIFTNLKIKTLEYRIKN
jgi:hypothetical protein